METRLGIIGIVITDKNSTEIVNEILHDFAHIIVGRMGLPYREKAVGVISLIVDATNADISALTGKLGRLNGVTAKSMLTK